MGDQPTPEVRDARDLGAFIPAFLDDYGLDPVEFRVYSRIVRRAGVEGHYESAAKVAAAIGVGERRVREALALLRAAGLVRCERRPGTTDRYWLTATDQWVAADQIPQLRDVSSRSRPDPAPGSTGPDPDEGGRQDRPVPTTAVDTTPVTTTDHPGPDDRTPRSTRPDTPVTTTDEGTPPKGIPGREESASPPVASGCDEMVELPSPGGEGTVQVDPSDVAASWAAFEARYPRHAVNRRPLGGGSPKKAGEKWRRMPVAERTLALLAVGNYALDLVVTGEKPCHAITWLNQARWEVFADPPDLTVSPVAAALADACGADPDRLTGEARFELVTAARAIEATGAGPDAVRYVVDQWRKKWPDIQPGFAAVARNWHRFAGDVRGRPSTALCKDCGQERAGHDGQLCEILSGKAA